MLSQSKLLNINMKTATRQIMVRLPEQIATRLDSVVPRRKRNQFIVDRLSEVIDEQDTQLAKIAAAVTAEEDNDPEYQQFIKDWEVTVGDGIDEDNAFDK